MKGRFICFPLLLLTLPFMREMGKDAVILHNIELK